MTAGPLLPNVLAFAVPLILSGMLQLLYNSADIIVVGRFARFRRDGFRRRDDLPHPSAGQPADGAERRCVRGRRCVRSAQGTDGVHRAVHTSMALAVLSGAALGVLLLALSRPLLEMMGCPADVVGGAQLYLNIYAVGLPASLVYNYGAAILRAVGDTKRPLYYLTVSGLVNVVLNVALVAGLRLGVAGVAIATVVSETISAALVLASLIASHGDVRFEPKKTRIERRSLSMILRIGIPAGLQSSMFSISNVLIQSAINSFGAAAIAGNTAAASIEGFATTVSNSISQAALTSSSQNMGAEKYARVRRVLLVCLAATFVGGLTLGLLIYTFGTPLLALFNTDPAVIASGLVRVRHNMPLYVLFCMQDTFVGQLRGVGYSLLPTITSLSGICLLRVWVLAVYGLRRLPDPRYALSLLSRFLGGDAFRAHRLLRGRGAGKCREGVNLSFSFRHDFVVPTCSVFHRLNPPQAATIENVPLSDGGFSFSGTEWRAKKMTLKQAAEACNMPVGTFY